MNTDAIAITVNGETREIPPQQSVANVLQHLSLSADRIAVELNRTIVRKRDWSKTLVAAGSQLEIVEFVGGG